MEERVTLLERPAPSSKETLGETGRAPGKSTPKLTGGVKL